MPDNEWQPITRTELDDLLAEETAVLSPASSARFAKYRVEPWQTTLRRSEQQGNEQVWVVAQHAQRVVFYDDVEEEFATGTVDGLGRLSAEGLMGELNSAMFDFPNRGFRSS